MSSLTVDIVATILVHFPGPLTVLLPWSSYSWSCLPTFAVPISHAPPVPFGGGQDQVCAIIADSAR